MATKTILIVEDDPVGRQTLHTALRAQGFDTVLAGDAMTALTLARNRQPSLIILDLGLPAGGGFTFLQRLRMFPALAVIPVIVVSGQDRATHEQAAIDAGASAFISKPAAPEIIIARIRELLPE
jgi:DNA-binding response OmpR family regulator